MDLQESPISENQRRAMVVRRLMDVSFGTMWWLREYMWKEIIPPELKYDLDSQKCGHPGVSILGGPSPLQTFIPMMHGRSEGGRRSVWITGFESDEPRKRTAFGHLIQPGRFPQLFLGHFPVESSALREEWGRMFGNDCPIPTSRQQMVFQPKGKHKATPDECRELRELLHELNII